MKVIMRITKVLIFLQKNIDETEDDDEDQHQEPPYFTLTTGLRDRIRFPATRARA